MTVITSFLIFSMLLVMWFDATRYIIPNWLVGMILAVYPVALYMSHFKADWKMALIGMLIVFAIGYLLFAKRWMGGGDVKLITVCSLWVGLQDLPDFIFLFSLYGGLLAAVIWGVRKFEHYIPLKEKPRILRNGEPVPYGLAIATAFITLVFMQRIPVIF